MSSDKNQPPQTVYLVQAPPPDPDSGENEIDLAVLWRALVDHKALIAKVTGATTAVALLASLLITPVYRAEVLLAPVSQDKGGGMAALASQFGDLASLAGISLGGGSGESQVQRGLAVLKSRALTEIFLKEEEILPVLFPEIWDREKKTWRNPWWQLFAASPGPSMEAAFRQFDNDIRAVTMDKRTGLITVSVEWEDPILAARWANSLVKRTNALLQKEAIEDSEKSIAFLQAQLSKTVSLEVQQAIYRLVESQTKSAMIASTREEFLFKVVDPAVAPERKVRPKRALIVVLGFIVGLLLGGVVAVVKGGFNGQVQKAQHDVA